MFCFISTLLQMFVIAVNFALSKNVREATSQLLTTPLWFFQYTRLPVLDHRYTLSGYVKQVLSL